MASLLFSAILPANTVYADASTDAAKAQVCQGVSGTGGNCASGGVDLTNTIKTVLYILSIVAGFAGVVMIVVSGFKYITSGGDAQAVSSAKRTLIYALVGLVIVALAQFIVRFVLSNAT